jgi:hypothetical protein
MQDVAESSKLSEVQVDEEGRPSFAPAKANVQCGCMNVGLVMSNVVIGRSIAG